MVTVRFKFAAWSLKVDKRAEQESEKEIINNYVGTLCQERELAAINRQTYLDHDENVREILFLFLFILFSFYGLVINISAVIVRVAWYFCPHYDDA